jgi:hypothetical protein
MRIHAESRIRHPLERVYAAYRDDLPKLAPYIPDVREIVVKERVERPEGPKIWNRWIGSRELPRILRGIVRPEMLQWDDFAEWNDAARSVDWRLSFPAFPDRVRCSGRNAFAKDGEATRITLSGTLEIDLKSFPGVPSLVARKVGPVAEEFIVRLVTPNLERVNQSLQRYLDERAVERRAVGT